MFVEFIEKEKTIVEFCKLDEGDVFRRADGGLFLKISDTCVCKKNETPEGCVNCTILNSWGLKETHVCNAVDLNRNMLDIIDPEESVELLRSTLRIEER